ncbi:MAG: aldehyde dehydrogenase family protein [Sphingobacteriaceae bacterium]|nr:aldehyde dehydrogenase family protein [Sphingobacteriaceae bacterium]
MNTTFLQNLGITAEEFGTAVGEKFFQDKQSFLFASSPVDGKKIAKVYTTSEEEYEKVIFTAQQSALQWRQLPAPKRGEIIRQIGDALRLHKNDLGMLVAYEMGKSIQEGYGEVQEMIDICDFAVGLSRQLYGLTMHSERPAHRMYEQWHPLGVVGVISAFNFPVAVWCWNAALAWVCGNVCVWKPSEKTPLCAIACQKIVSNIFAKNGFEEGISNIIIGDATLGKKLCADKRIALVSATGSTLMGKNVAEVVGKRLGKYLLELGGNNAMIISNKADLNLAIPAACFGAIGTAGQRCTSTRRLLIHQDIYDEFITKITQAYKQLKIGNPLDEKNHIGPLIDKQAVDLYLKAIQRCKDAKANILVEGALLQGNGFESNCYVSPSIVAIDKSFPHIEEEIFAPLLYVMKYETLAEAIDLNNNVPQGLSSSIMTLDMREMEQFLSAEGSDCGIANVNIGTSGAEIGGAFGGEKETGGGRESGSDAWRNYMRRQTNSINYGTQIPLAQGIKFNL